MIVRDLITAIESIAPRYLAESWDNTGLLLGSPTDEVSGPVLLTIDLTDAVLEEARAAGAKMIVAYHPPIFEAVKRLTDQSRTGRIVLLAARMGMAVYSPHTALDAAAGGMTDWLADVVGAGSREVKRRAIVPHAAARVGEEFKVVTFVPAEKAGAIRDAMGAAGAGVIGDYVRCSFVAPGTGTFLGGASSKPAVGEAGRLAAAAELRLEMVCSKAALAGALAALRGAHPYEEPAIDVYELSAHPGLLEGSGRVVWLEQPITVMEAAGRLLKAAGADAPVQYSGDRQRRVSQIALVPGAGGSLVEAAAGMGCELFITGEMKHHEVLGAMGLGMSVVLAGHTETERGYLPHLRERLANALAGATVVVSKGDGPPLQRV